MKPEESIPTSASLQDSIISKRARVEPSRLHLKVRIGPSLTYQRLQRARSQNECATMSLYDPAECVWQRSRQGKLESRTRNRPASVWTGMRGAHVGVVTTVSREGEHQLPAQITSVRTLTRGRSLGGEAEPVQPRITGTCHRCTPAGRGVS